VNWQHFRAFLWLRWRIGANQFRRGGTANRVILVVLLAIGSLLAVGLFVALFLVGWLALGNVGPEVILFTWDGLVVVFLFFWAIGLLTELQRSEALSLYKFLHLPVSLSAAFTINYLASLSNAVLIVFGPAMLGLALGLACSRGPAWLLQLPLLAAFVLAVTALTYQFQGWLAALMANPRRRRTVIVAVTIGIILICQIPNFVIQVVRPWKNTPDNITDLRPEPPQAVEQQPLAKNVKTPQELQKEHERLMEEFKKRPGEANQRMLQQAGEWGRLFNLVLPPGWLPLGASALAEGNAVPALLGTLGLGLIGAGSLWRAYRTTVRYYTGQLTTGKRKPAAEVDRAARGPAQPAYFLEKQLPGLSERASAIALSSFHSLWRAPEAKMMLLTPVLLVIIFGGMLLGQSQPLPVAGRPLLSFGAMAVVLVGMWQILGNQFGFDRGGFRVYVLCGAPRREILLGKNLAVAPFALGMGTLLAVVLQIAFPQRVDHFLAFFPQAVAMFLVFCLLANAMSIIAPLPVAAGSFKASTGKGLPILLNFAFLFVFPAVMGPLLLPLGVEVLLGWEGVPIYLLLALVMCAAAVAGYWVVLNWEGRWLQAREKKILQVVAAKAE
jgi:hypothetical protein